LGPSSIASTPRAVSGNGCLSAVGGVSARAVRATARRLAFDVGSAQGYVFVGSRKADGWTACYYDPSSGALVGVLEVAPPSSYCNGIVPQLDDDASLRHVTCPAPTP